jgi:hypothetical protein
VKISLSFLFITQLAFLEYLDFYDTTTDTCPVNKFWQLYTTNNTWYLTLNDLEQLEDLNKTLLNREVSQFHTAKRAIHWDLEK